MKLQHLRYAVETFRCNLNVSEAAAVLFTSQPGVSKQIRLLEEELGIQIFIRSGKRIVAVTQAGMAVLETAERILRDVQKIKHIGHEFAARTGGVLTVAATHTQARYLLPETVAAFIRDYPDVRLNIRQGSPDEIAGMVQRGEAEFAVSSEPPPAASELKRLMCSPWHYALLLPHTHPLLDLPDISLNDIAAYPLITYSHTLNPRSVIGRAFARCGADGIRPVFTAGDNDVLATYVKLGLGIGLLDKAACEHGVQDGLLVLRDISRLFEPAYTQIILRGDMMLPSYVYDFIQRLAPDMNREKIDALLYAPPADDFSI